VAKIGLIAPFEGLYRRTGYAALDASRSALADAQIDVDKIGVIPLALDDLANPDRTRRSGEKLMVDPTVVAVIGPLSPVTVEGARDALAGAPLWIVPYAVDPTGGFADPAEATAWADELVAAVAGAARQQGAVQLVLAGYTPGWPAYTADEWTGIAGMPVLLNDDPAMVRADDAVLWLGDPAGGARYLADLRAGQSAVPVWLGPQGGDPVFAERMNGKTPGLFDGVYWATWEAIGYNAPNFPDTPDAQLVYLATRAALDQLVDVSAVDSMSLPALRMPQWRVRFFSFNDDGVSRPVTFD
jgi:branched-chain amino acid transport system substrate-binding protein